MWLRKTFKCCICREKGAYRDTGEAVKACSTHELIKIARELKWSVMISYIDYGEIEVTFACPWCVDRVKRGRRAKK